MTENNYEKLKIVMTEYEILRREAEGRVKFQLQLYSITLTAISLVFGYVIVHQRYEALLLLPFITIMLAYRWIWDVKMIDAQRKYLLQIEEETIPRLMKGISEKEKENDYPKLVGWQGYYEDWRKTQAKDWLISALALFGIPTAISISYYVWFLINSLLHIVVSDLRNLSLLVQFPYIIYLLAIFIYGLVSFWILFKGHKLLLERESEERLRTKRDIRTSGNGKMEQRQNGLRFLSGIILGVISSAWIKSVFETVEARIGNNIVLDSIWSMMSIMFNIFLVIHVTIALVTLYDTPRWQISLWIIGLAIPILFTIPWHLWFF